MEARRLQIPVICARSALANLLQCYQSPDRVRVMLFFSGRKEMQPLAGLSLVEVVQAEENLRSLA